MQHYLFQCLLLQSLLIGQATSQAASSNPVAPAAVVKDPWGGLDSAEGQELKSDPDSLYTASSSASAGAQPGGKLASPAPLKTAPLHTSQVLARMQKRKSGYQPSAHEVIALKKAFEQISSLSTKSMCMHYSKANEVKSIEDLVRGFDVLCDNLMSHRHGFYGAHIVALPVGKMACRHTHAFLQAMKQPNPEDLGVNPSGQEMCGSFQEMIKQATAHLEDQERVTETLAEIGNLRLKQKRDSMKNAKTNAGKKYYKMHEL